MILDRTGIRIVTFLKSNGDDSMSSVYADEILTFPADIIKLTAKRCSLDVELSAIQVSMQALEKDIKTYNAGCHEPFRRDLNDSFSDQGSNMILCSAAQSHQLEEASCIWGLRRQPDPAYQPEIKCKGLIYVT